jgi:hypothetical protein
MGVLLMLMTIGGLIVAGILFVVALYAGKFGCVISCAAVSLFGSSSTSRCCSDFLS